MSAVAIAEVVAAALRRGEPVVALETTLVTHGLPMPDGLRVAAAMEEQVRAGGALPATVGVLDGAVRVGLDGDELARLADAGAAAAKVNLSNLAAQAASGRPGSTTVAATLWAAHQARIRVFATGGIGGVHRGDHGDVSADLPALGRFPVAVVCAGAKAVLDLARTVEALETLGVPVYGYRTDRFPAFERRESELSVDSRFDQLDALARAVMRHFGLGLPSAVVVANPIPPEHEVPRDVHERALGEALAQAKAQAVRGRALTPFLLERLRVASGGATLAANTALLLHNARVAGELAAAMAREAGA